MLLAPATVAGQTAPPAIAPSIRTDGQDQAPSPPARPRHRHAPGDPAEHFNRTMFSVHNFLDRFIFRPVAMVYKAVIPKPIRTGIRHVISNLGEPVVFVNDVLQLKPKRAVRTFARFAVNSTMGVGGILDVAKAADLPHRENGFGDTLGRYGVGPGPYLFIPFVGPTDLRDLIGGQADGALLPVALGDPFDQTKYLAPYEVVSGLDLRAESDADLKALLKGAADPYATLRSVFLQSRAAEIAEIRGKQVTSSGDDPLVDPEAPTGARPAQPDAFDGTPDDPEPSARPADPPAPPAATAAPTPPPADQTVTQL